MKKSLLTKGKVALLTVGTLTAIFTGTITHKAFACDRYRIEKATVSAREFNTIDGDVTEFKTSDGNLWTSYGYTESNNVLLIFDNNRTPNNVADDIILSVIE